MPNKKAAPQESPQNRNQPSPGSSDTKTSSDAPSTAVVETLEHRRFAEFCDACRKYRYIGLCYGAPGVGKTLSARHYAQWDLLEPLLGQYVAKEARPKEVISCRTLLYTPTVVNTPRSIDKELDNLSGLLRYILVDTMQVHLMESEDIAEEDLLT